VRVVNAGMANAARVVTVRRGVDPTGLTLVPFGGAGPLHASELAADLGIPIIPVPSAPGLLCAFGLLVEDLRTDAVRTHLAPLQPASLATRGRQSRPRAGDRRAVRRHHLAPPRPGGPRR
jgi:N-methylhydantoinase A